MFLAEGSGLGFHVAVCKRGVFTHQCSSVLGKPTFSTESVKSGHLEFPNLYIALEEIALANQTCHEQTRLGAFTPL